MISIGIPAYNRTCYLPEALRRCLGQSYDDFEVLVCDSSTHDGVKEIAGSFASPKLRYFRYDSATKITDKLNDMVKKARGDYMLVHCDDDQLEEGYLEGMAGLIAKNPEATLFRCRYRLIDKDGKLLRLDNPARSYMTPAEWVCRVFLREQDFFKMNISGIIFPRERFLSLGAFPVLPVPWHTERLAWTILASEGGCAYEEKPLCSIRLHPGSITSSFNPNLLACIESDIAARNIFAEVIEKVAARELSAEDRRHVDEARGNLKTYMERHMARSLDHGFITLLEGKKDGAAKNVRPLFAKMRELAVPTFRSARMYYWLSALPFMLRQPVVRAMKEYKVRKWCV